MFKFALENVSPVQEHIHPVTADAVTAATGSNLTGGTDADIMRRLVPGICQVRGIVPQHARANAHARRDKVPQIPFSKVNAAAVEVTAV